jgi:endonuclease/exonuclease/phosphatase family metal-dependent hydrolase
MCVGMFWPRLGRNTRSFGSRGRRRWKGSTLKLRLVPLERRKRKLYIINIALACMCFSAVTAALSRCATLAQPASRCELRVLTWNVLRTNRDYRGTAKFVRETGADIAFLQEVTPKLEAKLRVDLASLYSEMLFSSSGSGKGYALLSRYPIIESKHLANPRGGPPACWVELSTPAGPLQVLNLHLTSPTVLAGSWTDRIKSYASTTAVRLREVRHFCNALKNGVPAVVAGDLNSLEFEPAITFLNSHARLADAYRTVRPNPSTADTTWMAKRDPSSPIKARIDYVFVSRELVPLDAQVGCTTLSDHQPVTVILRWTHRSNEEIDCPRPSSEERP